MTSPVPGAEVSSGLHVRELRKRFGGVEALTGIDLDVAPGEIVAVLGRNGAGKSTLLRILGTTVCADSGQAWIDGHDVDADAAEARRRTGVVLGDERSWYWRLSGRANLEFFAALHGMHRVLARDSVAELLEAVQLSDVADRRFDGYSSGMRARLSVARALLGDPAALLLDEPTRTLDPVVAVDMRRLLRDSARRERRAVLWVTHDLHEAGDVADRIVVIDSGRIVAEPSAALDAAALEQLLAAV